MTWDFELLLIDNARLYLDQLTLSRNHLDRLTEGTTSTLDLLSGLSNSFKAVDLQTSSFQSRCEGVLLEQRRLNALADDIGQNLRYYSLLDPITRRLNAPGAGHSVRREDFSQMLTNLDQCLDYMKNHVRHLRLTSGGRMLTSNSLTRRKLGRTSRGIACY